MTLERHDVVVVGAGLAGLRCARDLHRWGLDVVVCEAGDEVGGRVRTDEVDGFLLDRGFQVLNDGYPEAKAALDLTALDLQRLDDAVLVRHDGRLHRLGNPLAHPTDAAGLVSTPLIGWGDKGRLATYAALATTLPASSLRRRPDVAARRAWQEAGIGEAGIELVLKSFFTGVVLEEEMGTSRRFLDLMMRMFALGRSTLPASGMRAIPRQLAAELPGGAVRLGCRVEGVDPEGADVTGGRLEARAVVVASDAWTAHGLLPSLGAPPPARGVQTVYHAAPVWEGVSGTLVADTDGSAVTNTIVVSAGAPSYAPAGQALVATSMVQRPGRELPSPDDLLGVLGDLHRTDTSRWRHLASYDLPRALPGMPAPHPMRRPVRVDHLGGRVYVTGDHRDTSSIQGALVSGRRAATAVRDDLSRS